MLHQSEVFLFHSIPRTRGPERKVKQYTVTLKTRFFFFISDIKTIRLSNWKISSNTLLDFLFSLWFIITICFGFKKIISIALLALTLVFILSKKKFMKN